MRNLPGVRDLLVTVACKSSLADLAPAQGRQNHATWSSASAPHVLRRRHVHRIPPRVRDDREPPLVSSRDGITIIISLENRKGNIFGKRAGLVGQISVLALRPTAFDLLPLCKRGSPLEHNRHQMAFKISQPQSKMTQPGLRPRQSKFRPTSNGRRPRSIPVCRRLW